MLKKETLIFYGSLALGLSINEIGIKYNLQLYAFPFALLLVGFIWVWLFRNNDRNQKRET